MTIIILLLLTIIIFAMTFLLFNKDIFSPSFLMVAGFVLAISFASMNTTKWGIDLEVKTIFIILIGMISFIAGEMLAFLTRRKNNNSTSNIVPLKKLRVETYKICFICLYDIIVIYLFYQEVVRIAALADPYWQQFGVMTAYKMKASYSTEAITSVSSMVVQMGKVTSAGAYICLFVLINNVFASSKKCKVIRENFKYLLPILGSIVLELLRGTRISIITMVISAIFLTYYFNKRKVGWNRDINILYVKKVLRIVTIGLIGFYLSKELVGRVSESNFFEYISEYIGGSIELLDLYVKDNISVDSGGICGEVLPGLYGSFRKLGIYETDIIKSLEFRYTPTGIYLGNVYTAFRRFYNDGSWLGLIVFPCIFSFFMNKFYIKIKKINEYSVYNIFLLIQYSYILYTVPLMAMEEMFYINKISIGFVTEMIIFKICIDILFKFKIYPTKNRRAILNQ